MKYLVRAIWVPVLIVMSSLVWAGGCGTDAFVGPEASVSGGTTNGDGANSLSGGTTTGDGANGVSGGTTTGDGANGVSGGTTTGDGAN